MARPARRAAVSEPTLVFLPWADRGGTATKPPDRPDAHPASQVTTIAAVFVNRPPRPASVPVQLMGPGEVTALAPQQIIRTDPAPGSRAFESNYLAARRVRRAGAAVAVHAGLGGRRTAAALAVPRRRGGRAGRPARPARDGTAARAADRAAGTPEHRAARPGRLLGVGACARSHPRRRAARPSARRSAATRPATCRGSSAAGCSPSRPTTSRAWCRRSRRAGGPGWARTRPARRVRRGRWRPTWRRSSCPSTTTGASPPGPAGDFQSLALAIRGRTVPDTFGSRPIDLSTAGLGLAGTDDAQIRLGGALRALDADPVAWSDPSLPARFATRADRGAQHARSGPRRDARARPAALRRRLPAGGRARPGGSGALVRAAQHRTPPTGSPPPSACRSSSATRRRSWRRRGIRPRTCAPSPRSVGWPTPASRWPSGCRRGTSTPLASEVGVFVVAPLFRAPAAGRIGGRDGDRRLLAGGDLTAHAFSATIRRVTQGARSGQCAARYKVRVLHQSSGSPRAWLQSPGPRRARVDVGPLATFEVLGAATPSALATCLGADPPGSIRRRAAATGLRSPPADAFRPVSGSQAYSPRLRRRRAPQAQSGQRLPAPDRSHWRGVVGRAFPTISIRPTPSIPQTRRSTRIRRAPGQRPRRPRSGCLRPAI